MPKGVEHYSAGVSVGKSQVKVQESLMPKGVEHPGKTDTHPVGGKVQESLMPKGVEH